jgi:hypothetical protein
MKKSIIIITALCMVLSMKAQQKDSPKFFRNTLEKCLYEAEHPESLGNPNKVHRFTSNFTARLDSVIGSDDFDWTQWKSEYTYTEEGLWNSEIYSVLENNQWLLSDKSEFSYDENGNCTRELHYKWDAETWTPYFNQSSYFSATGLTDSIVTSRFDSVWLNQNKRTYTYDGQRITELMIYQSNGVQWDENSKYEYAYNDEGQLSTQIYSTIRNGQWRVNSKDSLCYENGRCTELLNYTRRMWGGNGWILIGKTEFEYDGDRVISQTSYSGGWFGGGEMSFDGKTEFFYDSEGELVSKTTSIYNESEWIVRDEYANRFDTEKKAAEMMGCEAYWNLNSNYFTSDLGETLPITYRWLDAKVVSSTTDTQFTLYYSDMTDIEENESELKVYAANGSLFVESPTPTDVVVYDLLGRNVASESQTTNSCFSLKPGLYVVKAGNAAVKIVLD